MGSLVYNVNLTDRTIVKDYTYKDVSMDVAQTLDARDIETSLDIDAIQNGIGNLFMFARGERIILPEFGFNLYKYLYEPINDFTARNLGMELVQTLNRWEPRITVTNLNIEPDAENNTYYITLSYTVPSLTSDRVLNFNKAINIRR